MSMIYKIRKFMSMRLKATAVTAVVLAGSAGLYAAHVQAQGAFDCTGAPGKNAVVHCGAKNPGNLINKYEHGDGLNPIDSTHHIYDWFGIHSDDVTDMRTDTVAGSVDKNGNVFVGDTLVATDALTAGRHWIPGSQTVTFEHTTFYVRKPSVSFLAQSLDAMVVMQNGVFKFAILNACGNPVIGHPKKPDYSIKKLVSTNGGKDFDTDISVNSGTAVEYKIEVHSTGAVPVTNVEVNDKLPGDITYTSGTLKEDGRPISEAGVDQFFGEGFVVPSIKQGKETDFTFDAVAGKTSATADSCKAEVLDNEGDISTTGLPTKHGHAIVRTKCTPPQVSLTCDALDMTPGDIDQTTGDQDFELTAHASVKNATITDYVFDFGDGNSKTVATHDKTSSVSHTYTPGDHTASVEVMATDDSKTFTATSDACKKSITVKPPAPSSLACEALTLTPGTVEKNGDTTYTLDATASEQNATITSYVFDFGDGSNKATVNTGNLTASTSHKFAAGHTYKPDVVVSGTLANGQTVSVSSAKCAGTITIKPHKKPPTPVFSCDGLTATPVGTADDQGNLMYTLAATASATNATITSYTFDFGDSSQPQTVTTSDNSTSVNHTFAPGSHSPTASVTITLADGTTKTVTSAACGTSFTVSTPTCTAPNGQTFPAGSSQCSPAPTCTAPNGQTFPAGSSQCTPPTSLTNTGPGSVAGLFAGASAIGVVGYRWFISRRLARS